jgi:eukaryotic-like serine/threonine-protein kinase
MGQTRRFRPSGSGIPSAVGASATAMTERATRHWPTPSGRDTSDGGRALGHATEHPDAPAEELILGRYRLRRRLGMGGFGSVWLAHDERLERDVAIKLLARERVVGGRFEREARATARLNHPGIVTLYEAAVDDEGAYLVSELVRGSTLGRLLHDGRVSDHDIGLGAIALCDALEYAHGQGVVHRDVKPSNILVPERPHATADAAKLTDFGVAHVIGGDSLTRTGDVIGTTAYMSPEQAEGREVQAAADLYSLAVVIYEALTGVNPLRLVDLGVRGGRLGARLPPLRRQRRDLPRELGYAVDLALRPRARERGTITELRDALCSSIEQLEDEPGLVSDDWPRTPHAPVVGRPPLPRGAVSRRNAPPEIVPRRPAAARERVREPGQGERPVSHKLPLPARLTAAAAAAAGTAWFTATLLSPSAILPVVAMGLAAVLVMLLPRLGWIALLVTAAVILILQSASGAALTLVLAALPVTLLMLARPTRWPMPAAVPALGVIGLPGIWPALAGRAPTAWQRLALGGAGWLWLVAGELLVGNGVYLRLPHSLPRPAAWTPSLYDTYHQVLHPVILSGLLAPALVWGLAAVLLPRADRRSHRLAAGLVWGLLVAALTEGLLAALPTGAALHPLPAVLGALACAVLAAVPTAPGRMPRARHAPTPGPDSRSMEMR